MNWATASFTWAICSAGWAILSVLTQMPEAFFVLFGCMCMTVYSLYRHYLENPNE